MKSVFRVALLLLAALSFNACSTDDDPEVVVYGKWTSRSQYEGVARSYAVSFIINDKVYTGLGTDGLSAQGLTDFWEYTPTTNTWRRVADFPGKGRIQTAGFAVNGKGYVGTGQGIEQVASGGQTVATVTNYQEFYEYDPTANTWTRKADFPGSARYGAVGLSIGNKGYLGTGYDGNAKKDFWQYDPATNAWTVKPSFGGDKRLGASAFTIGNKGYILLGANNGIFASDVWSYDPTAELWTKHNDLVLHDDSNDNLDYDYSDVPRWYAASFVVGSKGYVATGYRAGYLGSCWEYNPTADTWTVKTSLGGTARLGAVGFGLGDTGYVALGKYSAQLDDTWSIAPDALNE